MLSLSWCVIFFTLAIQIKSNSAAVSNLFSQWPSGCDLDAALQCEYDFLTCRLFTGPVDDPPTLCKCGEQFYGSCLRVAGCSIAKEVGAFTKNELYLKKCVDHIIKYDCSDTMMCGINCATATNVNRNVSKIIPFNNYGKFYLRIRICTRIQHDQRLERYSLMQVGSCDKLEDFDICSRWIPPFSYVPVALPAAATYIEVDSCEYDQVTKKYMCHDEWEPQMIFGNKYLFPSTVDITKTVESSCKSNDDCLGSFCDGHVRPPMCSPKTIRHVTESGKYYLSDPFG
jgi:hypothetical protein